MTDSEDQKAVHRSDLRHALEWTLQRTHRVLLVACLLTLAGTGSVLGLLRWQHPYMRWSFAIICWLLAAIVLIRLATHSRRQE